jgi:hypothetical protein
MKILFNYTTRSRRSNFLRGIDSIVNNVADKSNYHILISVENENHDAAMHPLPQLDCPHTYRVNPYKPTSKVDAINRDLNEFTKVCDWDIVVNMSDDMIFTQKGFDDDIRESFVDIDYDSGGNTLLNGYDLDQCIHFPDGVTNEILISMSILGRIYYERFKYIYHPSYKSLWCDNETMDVAKMLGCYRYINKHIFKHLHPAHGNAPNDPQYQITESFYPIDNANYLNRKANGFT